MITFISWSQESKKCHFNLGCRVYMCMCVFHEYEKQWQLGREGDDTGEAWSSTSNQS